MTNLNLLFPGNDLLLLSLKMKDKSLISCYGNPVYVNFKELLLIGNLFDGFWQVIAHNFFCSKQESKYHLPFVFFPKGDP